MASDIEGDVAKLLKDAREQASHHVSAAASDEYLMTRLNEIEESLLALARHLDNAFAEIRGGSTSATEP
jgi:hypothetical protein